MCKRFISIQSTVDPEKQGKLKSVHSQAEQTRPKVNPRAGLEELGKGSEKKDIGRRMDDTYRMEKSAGHRGV